MSKIRNVWNYFRDNRVVVYAEATPLCNNKCYFCIVPSISSIGTAFISEPVQKRVGVISSIVSIGEIPNFFSIYWESRFYIKKSGILYLGANPTA